MHRGRLAARVLHGLAALVAAAWLAPHAQVHGQPAGQGAKPLAPAAAAAQASSAPGRIVSFVPAVTEMLFAIGAGPRVVGVSAYDRFPADAVAGLPRVGGLLDPNVERVLSLRPDLVIVYSTQQDLRGQLARAHIAEYEYRHRDLADVTRTLRAVGSRMGLAEAGERVASRIEDELSAVRREAAGRPHPRTLLVFGREAGSLRRIQASGGYGFLHDLVELAGGDDVLSDVRRESVELSSETVLARAPDVIIELKYGRMQSTADLARLARDWDRLPGVPAVRTSRVYVLQGDEFVVPGPRVVDAARALADAIRKGSSQGAGIRR